MKKTLAFLLSFAIIFSTCAFAVYAEDKLAKEDITDYPVIMVAGYSSSTLIDKDTGEQVWGLDGDKIISAVLENIAEIGMGLGAMTVGNAEIIAATVGRELGKIVEKMRCNPDGTSVYNIGRAVYTAEDTNSANLIELYPDGKYRHEQNKIEDVAEYIGNENIFNFQCDFRMGAEFCANQLNELIKDVKKYTKKDKVNLFAVSHGGQVSATYLTLFGHQNDVDNALLTVPAIGGAGIAYDALMACVELDEEGLLQFIQHGMRWEEDYDWLLKAQKLGFLDDIVNALIPHVFDEVGYWGSLWDFMPADKYEEAKKALLDPKESANLIKTSDRFHYEILPAMNKKLTECIKNGMNISIISGTGSRVVTGMHEYSDAIITTAASTGAKVAPFGQRFAKGYKQINACGGKNKISPDMTIDASAGYLPDNTWYVNKLYHGMTNWDYYTRMLSNTLLLTDNITSVYSDPSYPQFRDTTNPSHAVYAEFKGCQPGEITGEAKSLVITNCCWENDIRLSAILCDGTDMSFKVNPTRKLAPGESIELEIGGAIPEGSGYVASVTVYYTMGTITPLGSRTLNFSVKNGEKVNGAEGYESIAPNTPFDNVIPEMLDSFLKWLGIKEFFSIVYNIFYYWLDTVLAL